jgi:hypothetical protein
MYGSFLPPNNKSFSQAKQNLAKINVSHTSLIKQILKQWMDSIVMVLKKTIDYLCIIYVEMQTSRL